MQQPINRGDPNGTDFFEYCWDEMSNRSFMSPFNLGSIAGGYQGNTADINSSYYVWRGTQNYNEYWINSSYNVGYQSPTYEQIKQNQLRNKMKNVREKGKAGETAVGYPKNTRHATSFTQTASYRVPDIWTKEFVGEVKNYSRPVRLTSQIIDEMLLAEENNIPFVLFTNAPLAPDLKELYEDNKLLVRDIPKHK